MQPSERSRLDLSRLTPERTMFLATFVVVFMLAARLRVDTDVWWHLRAGAYMLEHGVIRSDSFSSTMAGQAWIDHSWAADVVFQLIWRALGYGGLELATGALALVGAGLVYAMSPGGTYLRCLAVGLAAIAASIFWAPRPQMFSFALTAVVLYILFLRRQRGVDRLWVLPVVMFAWANLHAGFVIGLAVIAITIAGEILEHLAPLDDRGHLDASVVRRLCLVLLACLVAVCVNPYGPRILIVPFETASSSFTYLIEEWRPPDLHNPSFWPFALLVVLLIGAIGASPVRAGWSDSLLCAGAVLLAFSAGRNVSTFAVVVPPVIAYHVHESLRERGRELRPLRRATIGIVAVNVLLLALVVGITAVRVSASFRTGALEASERRTLPLGAVRFLRENGVRGRLFNTYEWGGYLMHELPRVPVFVDGRSDLYGSDFLYDPYLHIAEGGPGYGPRLDRYAVGTVLVKRWGGLASVLGGSPDWRRAYEDDLAVVFERKSQAQ